MLEPKEAFKKSTFPTDKEINEFHFILSSLLRWDLPNELKEQYIANSLVALEFYHSQYLFNCVSRKDVFDVLLGDRLKVDPKYIRRLFQLQTNVELYARYQSICTNRKATSKYISLLSELIDSFDNPENDNKLIDFKKILNKWINS